MWLIDLIKDIPHILTLQAKIQELKTQNAGLETEVAILKDDKRQLKAEILKLKEEMDRLTHKDLDEADIKVLAYIAKSGGSANTSDIEQALQLPSVVFKKAIGNLSLRGYTAVIRRPGTRTITGYRLRQKGLVYAVNNELADQDS